MADTESCRIIIAGQWASAEFADLFSEMDFLNDVAHFSLERFDEQSHIEMTWFEPRRFRYYGGGYFDRPLAPLIEEEIESLSRRLELRHFIDRVAGRESTLEVNAISFGSPGFVDLLGAGRVVAEIRKFVLGVVDRYQATEDRELARESKKQEILEKKIRNAERLLKLSEKAGLDSELKRDLMRELLQTDYFLESKLLDGKIISVEKG